jgi:ADP-ribose pyrophosphatase YjhB (NUDIX family)
MTDPRWLEWANRIRSIARAGLTYTEGPFDRERYEQLQAIAAEMLAAGCESDFDPILDLLKSEMGYMTPKVDVRGVVFDAKGRLLLVQEHQGQRPVDPARGWADIYDSPSEAVLREIPREEAGYEARAVKLLAVWDRDRHGHPPHRITSTSCSSAARSPARPRRKSGPGTWRRAA